MQFDPHRLVALDIPETVQRYGPQDCVLYALGVGAGMDPMDERQLAFIDEARLRALPTMAVVLGYTGFWVDQVPTGINAARVLHGAQMLRVEAPLPLAGTIRRKTRIDRIVDRGAGRGALIGTIDEIWDAADGRLLTVLESTILCRDEGGLGGTHDGIPAAQPMPDRPPDGNIPLPSSPQQALIYRLSGDRNPLHSDPAFARGAGFARPILHGLASYGMAGMALLCALADGDPARLRAIGMRFTSPVFPGEALNLDYWMLAADAVAFRLRARDGNRIVADHGRMELVQIS